MVDFYDLIPVTARAIGSATVPTVNLRHVHQWLEVGRDYSTWIKARIQEYGWVEGRDYHIDLSGDFCSPDSGSKKRNRRGSHNAIEYYGTTRIAIELAMVDNKAKGRLVRAYFIEAEERLRCRIDDERVSALILETIKKMLPDIVADRLRINSRSAVRDGLVSGLDCIKDKVSPNGRRALVNQIANGIARDCRHLGRTVHRELDQGLGDVRVPFAGNRPDHRAGIELATINAHCAAEAATDIECRPNNGVTRKARRDRFEIADFPGRAAAGNSVPPRIGCDRVLR